MVLYQCKTGSAPPCTCMCGPKPNLEHYNSYIYILLLLLLLLLEVAVAVVVVAVLLLLLLYTVYMGMDVSFSTELYNNKGIAGMHPEVAPPLAYSIDMEYRQFFRRKSSLKMLFSTCMLVDGRVS